MNKSVWIDILLIVFILFFTVSTVYNLAAIKEYNGRQRQFETWYDMISEDSQNPYYSGYLYICPIEFYRNNNFDIDNILFLNEQRHNITENEMLMVEAGTTIEEFGNEFGAPHGKILLSSWDEYFYELEGDKYACVFLGVVNDKNIITSLQIRSYCDKEWIEVVF